MMKNSTLPIVAVLIAIAITSTMDFTGYTVFSALPLLGIIVYFGCYLDCPKRKLA